MDDSDEPQLLEYARLHGIATDHQANDPIRLAVSLLETDSRDDGFSDPPGTSTIDFSGSRNKIEDKLRNEKLEMGKDVAIFLSSVLAEIPSTGGFGLTDAEWDESRKRYCSVKDLKLDCPLLTAESEHEMATFGKRPHPDTVLSDLLPLEREEQTGNDEGLFFPDYFWELPDEICAEVESEKLDCSKGTLRVLQEARLPDKKAFMSETIELLNTALDFSEEDLRRPISPLYLEPENQFTPPGALDPIAALPSSSDFASPYKLLNGVEVEGPLRDSFDSPVSPPGYEEHNYTSNRDNSLEELSELPRPDFSNESRAESLSQNEPRRTSHLSNISLPPDAEGENDNTQASQLSDHNVGIEVKGSSETVPLGCFDMQLDNDYSELVSVAMQAVDIVSKRRSLSFVGQESPAAELSSSPEAIILTSTNEGKGSQDSSHIRGTPIHGYTVTPCPSRAGMHHEPTLESFKSSMDTVKANEMNSREESPTSASVSATTVISPLPISVQPKLLEKHSDKVNGGTTEEPGPERLIHRKPHGVNPLETENRENHQENQAEDRGETITISGLRAVLLNYQKIRSKSSNIPMCNSMLPPAMSTLGTLSTFMETRGRESKRRKTERSPYFNKVPSENIMTESPNIQVQVHETTPNDEKPQDASPEPDYAHLTPETPRNMTQFDTPVLLIISAALLQSDRHLVRRLENLPHTPRLIFRDYKTFTKHGVGLKEITTAAEEAKVEEEEADIIVSSQTGIILTTSQETTQLYLPGHKKKVSGQADGMRSAGFDSPIRERIARVAMRYEQLYVLIRLPLESRQKISLTGVDSENPAKSRLVATNPKTLSSIRSLMAFCASLGRVSAIIPFLVPASEIDIVDCICSIARKHALNPSEIQKCICPSRRPQEASPYFAAATPSMDDFLPSSSLFSSLFSYLDEETQWEIFLRRAGFNPFAAQTVLGILKIMHNQRASRGDGINNNTGQKVPDDSKAFPDVSTISTVSGNTNVGPEVTTGSAPPAQGLSLFIELEPAERERLFGKVVGERVLRRVERCIVQDWQLDWAVNLDDDMEMDMEIDTSYMDGDVH